MTDKETAHSPLPWTTFREYEAAIKDADKTTIVNTNNKANAAHIVKCVNAHPDLVSALNDSMELLEKMGAAMSVVGHGWRYEEVVRNVKRVLRKAGVV